MTLGEDFRRGMATGHFYFSEKQLIIYEVVETPVRNTIFGEDRFVLANVIYLDRRGNSRYHQREMSFEACEEDRPATSEERKTFEDVVSGKVKEEKPKETIPVREGLFRLSQDREGLKDDKPRGSGTGRAPVC